MPDLKVFDKIQKYLTKIDSNKDDLITQNEIQKASKKKKVPSIWLQNIKQIMNGQDMSRMDIIMGLGVEHTEESDKKHTPDPNSDGGKFRFRLENEENNYQMAIDDVKFFVERSVEKWFSFDLNVDGVDSKIENHRWKRFNNDDRMNDKDLNTKEYADKYKIVQSKKSKKHHLDYKKWIKDWIEAEIYCAAYDYGVTLKEEDLNKLAEYAKIQINAKLVKPGQDKTSSLYNRLGNDAYTRIITNESTNSCCGGSVVPPPSEQNREKCSFVFKQISENTENTSEEVKNRLAWAAFVTPEPEKLYNKETQKYEWSMISEKQYQKWHQKWNEVKSLTAQDYKEMLQDEKRRTKFESNSNMSVQQIFDYINIVETVTGKDFDSNDWSINHTQFYEICNRVNGVYGGETVLNGKTVKDILPERKDLYEYLKKNEMLLPQFQEE